MTTELKSPRNLFRSLAWLALVSLVGSSAPGEHPAKAASEEGVIRAAGQLQPAAVVELRNETGGEAQVLWLAPEGKRARKGALLARLDTKSLEKKLDALRARASLTKARLAAVEASLEATRVESRAQLEVAELAVEVASMAQEAFGESEMRLELRSARADLTLAEKQLEIAADRKKRLESLARVRPEPDLQDRVAQAELQSLEAQARVEATRARLEYITGSARPLKLKQLELEVAQRKLELIRARNEITSGIRKGEAEIAAARAARRKESEELARIEERIDACDIHAPRDGLVVYPRHLEAGSDAPTSPRSTGRRRPRTRLEPGARLRDQQALLQVVDTSRCRLEVEVPLSVAREVSTGEVVTVHVDALPHRPLEGRIAKMGVAEGRPGTSHPPDRATIAILLENSEGHLRPGMTATAQLETKGEE